MTHRGTSSNLSHPYDPLLQRFGATLRQYRQQRGLSHRALAARMGIRSSYVSEIELGKRNIAVLTLLRMTHALDIPAAYLLEQVDSHATFAPPFTPDPLPVRGTRKAIGTHGDTCSLQLDDLATLIPLLGATIRQYRQQLGLSQSVLATRTGLTVGYISEIEKGQRNLSVLSLIRIADALGLAVAHLLAPLETCQNPSPPLPR